MVGNVGRADRAEIDRVEGPQLIGPVGRHHHALLAIIGGAPVEGLNVEFDVADPLREALEHGDTGGDDLGTDAIGRNGGD